MELPSTVPLFFGLPAGPEMLIILLIVVLLFGANKLPKLARASGQALGEFQKGRSELERELSEMNPVEDGDEDDEEGETDADAADDVGAAATLEPEAEAVETNDSDPKPAA
ncbi:twin-arginine translocase TatA/TatE family subunit [Halobium salinum]|uniref:Sec-independent protein translocase protein TatA n=1 Tax=Halobium salinum TaxID=1364940 RepID=A0ABD5PAY8_9EURY|nr:twin-arginine translocase TatA/TatE family subunit [Halobium salinum]